MTAGVGPGPWWLVDSGLFCVFEGLDGAGKTTLIHAVHDLFRTRLDARADGRFPGIRMLREPTDLPSGKLIREKLRDGADLPRSDWLDLFVRDRAENVKTHIIPLKKAGYLLLQDRYFYSSAAYQGHPVESPTARAAAQTNRDLGFPEPDILFYLEISPEAALERIHRTRPSRETFETLDYLTKIAANYGDILPDWTVKLEATKDPAELRDAVIRQIDEFAAPGAASQERH